MTIRERFGRVVLRAYPREFREQFGEQILADLEGDPRNAIAQLFDLLRSAIATHIDTFARDVGYAVRRLRAAPLFAAIVVLTFALGIGANVAVFSVFNSLVLRPLPFAHAASLVVVEERGLRGGVFPAVSGPDASDLASQSRSIADLATERSIDHPTMFVDGKPFALHGIEVSPNYLTMLGITPELGRGFSTSDARPGAHNIVISDEIWRKYFGADPHMLGRTIFLDGHANHVIGILPPHQLLPLPNGETIETEDLLRALQPDAGARDRGFRSLGAVAVLAPGVNVQRADTELALISERLARAYPLYHKGSSFLVVGLRDLVLRRVLASLWIVLFAVVGILLITCANVGNMLAARWSSRDRELAIRRALGASTGRITYGLLVETGILALAGALVGVALAFFTLQLLNNVIARLLPDAVPIGLDVSSLLYALAIVVVATLLAGLTPMLTLGAGDLQLVLKSAGRGGDTSRRHYVRGGLVIVEVALAIALVTVSGLMLRNLIDVIDTPLGIRTAGIVTTDPIALPIGERENSAAQIAAQQLVLQYLARVPAVDAAALALGYPESGSDSEASVPVFGRTYTRGNEPEATVNAVSLAYFHLFGERIVRGRTFTSDDTAGSAPVAVVNERFAARYLQGHNPLGTRIALPTGPGAKRWTTIVGVVSDERLSVTAENAFGSLPISPELFVPLAQYPEPLFMVIVHAPRGDSATIGREVQSALAQALPLVPPPRTFTIAERIQNDTVQARFTTALLASLGFIALVLALSGIFGVTSYSVTHRVHEFGVRLTLGATAGAIIADVLRGALATTAIGVAGGVIVAACAARAIVAQLGAVSPFDVPTFAKVIILVFLAAAVAALEPALRATRVQPAEALGYE